MNWITRIFVTSAINKIIGEDKMKKIKDFMAGKKTYVNLILGVGVGVAMSFGVVIPEWALIILGSLTGITYKMGQNRIETATKELVDSVKEEIKPPVV